MYRITPDICLIHTVDFFPPIVDDPYEFGLIAAANSLSDVYAMGGRPISALNLLTMPKDLDLGIVRRILEGGNEKALEAGINISGGHSIEDLEPKYGLSVAGVAKECEILPNGGAHTGDALVLTKPLGSGVLTTADKAGLVSTSMHEELVKVMAALNRRPAELAHSLNVHGCTDITGFGLLGHAAEMAEASAKTILVYARSLPLLEGAAAFAKDGIIPGGAYRNRDFLKCRYRAEQGIPLELEDLAFDPQTSGGLLFALPFEDAQELVRRLHDEGLHGAIVGEVIDQEKESVRLLFR